MRWHRWQASVAGRYAGDWLLGFLGAHAVPGLESWDGTTYRRALRPAAAAWAVVEVTAVPAGLRGRVGLPSDAPAPARAQVSALLHHLFAVGDSTGAETALAADPMLGPLVAARPGLRLPGSADPGQDLVRTVIGQQVSVAGARTVTGRVLAALGDPLPAEAATASGLALLWPPAGRLAQAPDGALPMPAARARAVRTVAAAAASGSLPWHDPDALRPALLALPGVGPWTADYTLVRATRAADLFLPGDLAARRQVQALGGPGDPAAVAELARRWSPHRSTALAQLWAAYLAS